MQDRQGRPAWDEESDDAIRAADADREAIAEFLRKHHADGRLTDDEFQQRLEQSMSAKTLGELRALVADLPSGRPRRERRPDTHPRRFGLLLLPALIVLALVLTSPWRHAAWHGGAPHFHFLWPLIFGFAAVMFLRGRARCGAHHYRRTRYM